MLFCTSCSKPLQNYMVFNDTDGVYTYTFEAEKKVWHFVLCAMVFTVWSPCDLMWAPWSCDLTGRLPSLFFKTGYINISRRCHLTGCIQLSLWKPEIVRLVDYIHVCGSHSLWALSPFSAMKSPSLTTVVGEKNKTLYMSVCLCMLHAC